MKTMKYKIKTMLGLLFMGLSVGLSLNSQESPNQFPEIGKPILDFEIKNIIDYSQKRTTYSELKGKPTILYFWSRYCSSAVRNISKLNGLNQQFGEKINIFLVGGEAADAGVGKHVFLGMEPGMENLKELYSNLKQEQGLKIPVAFDPLLFQRFVPESKVPCIIYIDSKGIVKAITNAIDQEKVKLFLADKDFFFRDISNEARQKAVLEKVDEFMPFESNGQRVKNPPFLYRSLFTHYEKEGVRVPRISNTIDAVCRDNSYRKKGWLQGSVTLSDLYKLAYFGYINSKGVLNDYLYLKERDYNQLILELKDKSLFSGVNYETRKNLFIYSLIVPSEKAIPEYIKDVMQGDLKNYFGYQVKIEKRMLPYWRLTVLEKAKSNLKTKGGDYRLKSDGFTNFSFQNVSVDNYIDSIFYMVKSKLNMPIINETGLAFHIDIPETTVLLSDFDTIKGALKKQGFEMEIAHKEFRVLVISD